MTSTFVGNFMLKSASHLRWRVEFTHLLGHHLITHFWHHQPGRTQEYSWRNFTLQRFAKILGAPVWAGSNRSEIGGVHWTDL